MTRIHYTDALYELDQQVLKMGVLVVESLQKVIAGLCDHNMALLEKVKSEDEAINKLEFEIDDRCTVIIATEQPVAQDLRHLIAILKIVTQLERMGDHTASIAKVGLVLGTNIGIIPMTKVKAMSDIVIRMINEILSAFLHADAENSVEICSMDDEVDRLRNELHNEIMKLVDAKKYHPDDGLHALFINRFIERIADQATNIAEWIIFDIKGEHQELNSTQRA